MCRATRRCRRIPLQTILRRHPAARCRALIANRKRIQQLYCTTTATPVRTPANPRPQPQANTDIDSDFYNRFLEIFRSHHGRRIHFGRHHCLRRWASNARSSTAKIKALTNYSRRAYPPSAPPGRTPPTNLHRKDRQRDSLRNRLLPHRHTSQNATAKPYGENPSEPRSKLSPRPPYK